MKFTTLFLIVIGLCAVVLFGMIAWTFSSTPTLPEAYRAEMLPKLVTLRDATDALEVRRATDVFPARLTSPSWRERTLTQVQSVLAAEEPIAETPAPATGQQRHEYILSSAELCAFGAGRLRWYINNEQDRAELIQMERHLADCRQRLPRLIDQLQ